MRNNWCSNRNKQINSPKLNTYAQAKIKISLVKYGSTSLRRIKIEILKYFDIYSTIMLFLFVFCWLLESIFILEFAHTFSKCLSEVGVPQDLVNNQGFVSNQ